MNVQWRKDSIPLDATWSQSRIVTRAQPQPPSPTAAGQLLTSELSVTNAAAADEGLYECAASNVYGEDGDAVFLQVQDVPQPPLDVRVANAAGRRIQLEWKPPAADGGNPIQEFVIFYQSPSKNLIKICNEIIQLIELISCGRWRHPAGTNFGQSIDGLHRQLAAGHRLPSLHDGLQFTGPESAQSGTDGHDG